MAKTAEHVSRERSDFSVERELKVLVIVFACPPIELSSFLAVHTCASVQP